MPHYAGRQKGRSMETSARGNLCHRQSQTEKGGIAVCSAFGRAPRSRTGRFSLCMGWFSKTFTQHALSRGILQVLMGYERGAASMNGFNAFGAQVGGSRPAKQQDVSSLLRDVTPLGSRAAANAERFSPERLAEIAETSAVGHGLRSIWAPFATISPWPSAA